MDKRKIFTAIMAISMLITTFSGCSSNQKQSYGNLGKGDESDRPEVEDIVIDNESDIYNIGDEIQVKSGATRRHASTICPRNRSSSRAIRSWKASSTAICPS